MIEKFDKDTFRAWETYRRDAQKKLVDTSTVESESIASEASINTNASYLPSWAQLESFLEEEIAICRHESVHQRVPEMQKEGGNQANDANSNQKARCYATMSRPSASTGFGMAPKAMATESCTDKKVSRVFVMPRCNAPTK